MSWEIARHAAENYYQNTPFQRKSTRRVSVRAFSVAYAIHMLGMSSLDIRKLLGLSPKELKQELDRAYQDLGEDFFDKIAPQKQAHGSSENFSYDSLNKAVRSSRKSGNLRLPRDPKRALADMQATLNDINEQKKQRGWG